jgi:hypothetical protein
MDYLKLRYPEVEQTREEGDAIRRKSLQDAYNKLANPTGIPGSTKEVLKKQAAPAPAPAKGPTFKELLDPLNAYFDKREADKQDAERAKQPVVIGGVAQAPGYGAKVTPQAIEAESAQQRAARIMYQGPRTPVEDYVPPAPVPVEPKISASNPARVTGRLIRKAGQVGDATQIALYTAAEGIKKSLAKDPVLNPPSFNPDEVDRQKTIQQRLAPFLKRGRESIREFNRGLQGQ